MPYKTPELRRIGRKKSYIKRKEKINKKEKEYKMLNPEAFKSRKLKHRYGITLKDFERRLIIQNGLCALCKDKKAVDVDHCHETGRVRGLLCRGCNVGLGQLGDNINGLLKAINI